jgi:aryl-alcohol dehydrogenase-like predicted oxidoreductase
MQTRRAFIRSTTTAATLGISAANLSVEADNVEWRNRNDAMSYRRLGRTGFMVSEIVMGGNEINPNNYKHVLNAIDQGLNYLDTAPAYGRGQSELGFAKVLKEVGRDRVFLNSKISLWDDNRNEKFKVIYDSLDQSAQRKLQSQVSRTIKEKQAADPDYLVNYFGSQRNELEAAVLSNVMESQYGRLIDRNRNYKQVILKSVDESLARLGTDHLDIVMCPHGASSEEELTLYPEVHEAFNRLKQSGKVRYLGVSSHSDPAGVLKGAIKAGIYSVAMVAYNIVNHPFLHGALKQANKNGVGVVAMKVARAVNPGRGRGNVDASRIQKIQSAVPGAWSIPQKAYLWALKNPHLSAAISNMTNLEQVEANLKLPQAMRES